MLGFAASLQGVDSRAASPGCAIAIAALLPQKRKDRSPATGNRSLLTLDRQPPYHKQHSVSRYTKRNLARRAGICHPQARRSDVSVGGPSHMDRTQPRELPRH